MKLLKAAIAAVFASLSFGCAYVDQSIDLKYTPNEHSYPGQRGEIVLIIQPTSGIMQNNNGLWIIGSLNDRHGQQQAELLSSRNPVEWIEEAFRLELTRAGYIVINESGQPAGPGQAVRVEGINIFSSFNRDTVGTDANHLLKLEVDLLKNGTRVRTFSVTSKLNNQYKTCITSSEKETLIQKSLNDAIRQVLAEIKRQADQK